MTLRLTKNFGESFFHFGEEKKVAKNSIEEEILKSFGS